MCLCSNSAKIIRNKGNSDSTHGEALGYGPRETINQRVGMTARSILYDTLPPTLIVAACGATIAPSSDGIARPVRH